MYSEYLSKFKLAFSVFNIIRWSINLELLQGEARPQLHFFYVANGATIFFGDFLPYWSVITNESCGSLFLSSSCLSLHQLIISFAPIFQKNSNYFCFFTYSCRVWNPPSNTSFQVFCVYKWNQSLGTFKDFEKFMCVYNKMGSYKSSISHFQFSYVFPTAPPQLFFAFITH